MEEQIIMMLDNRCADQIEKECSRDDIIIEMLRSIGFNKTADAWEAIPKWYS